MTEEKDERRRRRAAFFLGLLALLGVSVLIGAALAPAAGNPPLRVKATRTTVVLTAGDYNVVLRGTGQDAVAGAVVRLKVQSESMAGTGGLVQVSGTLGTVLRPGAGAGLNLSLTNPNGAGVRISGVSATLASVSAPRASAGRPCTLADFEVLPYTGSAVTLTPRQTRSLEQLDVPAAQWPQVRMRNTSSNQDGCQGATVTFTYGVEGRSE